ncbi:hypothetical protein Tco_0717179 [Tanacetum coccineum]
MDVENCVLKWRAQREVLSTTEDSCSCQATAGSNLQGDTSRCLVAVPNPMDAEHLSDYGFASMILVSVRSLSQMP